ncbi:MAG: YifB family Mg chelatase-like AAA ATPase [Thermoleophilaceae bacterium]|nr:YifB family Mg chelatase-like AAA ATPase [Thermoleophilaceae bacterium]
MLASIPTYTLDGVDSREVTVEVDVRRGLPAFAIVGLPGPAVKEARDRVRSALVNSGFDFPMSRLTANLAPASVRKVGPSFDLALAVAVLAASGQLDSGGLEDLAVCGELSLGGELRPVRGALAMATGARRAGMKRLAVPEECAGEAALVEGLDVVGVPTLARFVAMARGEWTPEPALPACAAPQAQPPDLCDVRGQRDARRALEIAAAGGHNVLMVGPPGVGKTMLARRLPGILPAPSLEEALEVTQIHGAAGLTRGGLVAERPFRAPHHTISAPGLIGGGSVPRPGEITLAHRGVLFLDELPEFSRPALEALRQPLEAGSIEVMRSQRTLVFPAAFNLIAACNPCPCAKPGGACTCSDLDRARYHRRLSGPLMDRIDLTCQLDPRPPVVGAEPSEASEGVRARVEAARLAQRERLAGSPAACNAELVEAEVAAMVRGSAGLRRILHRSGMSARGHDRVVRVAQTIADLDGREALGAADVEEAVAYRAAGSEAMAVAA